MSQSDIAEGVKGNRVTDECAVAPGKRGHIGPQPESGAVQHSRSENAEQGKGQDPSSCHFDKLGPGYNSFRKRAEDKSRRLDPGLNSMDRFALSLAHYFRARYPEAVDEAERNLRKHPGANFSRIVLAAAYAEQNRAEEVARVVPAIRQFDPAFDPNEFGSKLRNVDNLEHLREGLRKAGLLSATASR